MQHCLLGTGKTSGTTGATALTGLVTSHADPLLVVEATAAAVLTAAVSQHLQRVSAGHTVLLCGTPAPCTGLVTDCAGVAILVETVPTGGHTLSLLHQQGRQAGRTLQSAAAGGTLWLAG